MEGSELENWRIFVKSKLITNKTSQKRVHNFFNFFRCGLKQDSTNSACVKSNTNRKFKSYKINKLKYNLVCKV
jgi:hypothetical protein